MNNIQLPEKIHIKALAIAAVCASAIALFVWLMVLSYPRVNTEITTKDQQLESLQTRVDNLNLIISNHKKMGINNEIIIDAQSEVIIIQELKLNQLQYKFNECIDKQDGVIKEGE